MIFITLNHKRYTFSVSVGPIGIIRNIIMPAIPSANTVSFNISFIKHIHTEFITKA